MSVSWATDDSPYIMRAIDEYSLRTGLLVESFGQLHGKPALDSKSPESWVSVRAWELKQIDKN